jgi:pSer/pThr/pTyr-binding forkhead associated (FHA) protein
MDQNKEENTISLWGNEGKRDITLKNLQTGKRYSFVLRHSFIVGRKKEYCDLVITEDDRYISGRHLRFLNEDGGIYVEDMHTKNGTRLNGKPLSSRTRIKKGDILKLGRSEFEIIYK